MQNSYYFSLSHQVKLLWSADFQIPEVADAMTLSRFEDIKGFSISLTTCPSLVMTRSRKSTIHGFFCGAGGYAYDFEVSLFCACQVTAFLVIYCFVIVLQLSYQEASKYEFNV